VATKVGCLQCVVQRQCFCSVTCNSTAANTVIGSLKMNWLQTKCKISGFAWFEICAAVWMRSALFGDFTQRRVVIPYRRCVTTYRSPLQDLLTPEDGTGRFARNVVEELPFCAALNPKRAQISFQGFFNLCQIAKYKLWLDSSLTWNCTLCSASSCHFATELW